MCAGRPCSCLFWCERVSGGEREAAVYDWLCLVGWLVAFGCSDVRVSGKRPPFVVVWLL